MTSASPPFHALDTGTRLVVRRAGEAPRQVLVVQVKDGLVWISARDRPGEADELVEIEHSIPGDAAYRAPARVVFVPPETWALRRVGDWERVQRREDVRIGAAGLELAVDRPGSERPKPDREQLLMIDVSAGGVSARSPIAFEVGDEVRCEFSLPGGEHFEMPARVVRVRPEGRTGVRTTVAFQFLDLTEAERSALLRWIYREQARRRLRHKGQGPAAPGA
jgi:hypothetical protein